MNQYTLINENNIRFSLTDFTNQTFIPSLKGLGYENSFTFIRVGNTFKTDYKELVQGILSGTVISSSYENYRSLINYIENSTSLRLIYKPLDIEYFRDVEFGGITDPIRRASTTEAEIRLHCNGLYYTENQEVFSVEAIEGQSQYDLVFDYVFNDYATSEITYTNPGHVDSEMIVEFFGYLNNPKIELFVNDVLKYQVTFNIEVQENEKLIYSVRDNDMFVVLENELGIRSNVVSCLDITQDNYFKIPRGVSSIRVGADSSIFTKITFTIFTAYKGV